MKVELTDRYLIGLEPPVSGRVEFSDVKRRGLRFRLSASGSGTWMYEKRVKGGQKRKHTLGPWPTISLSEARAVALEIEAEAVRGFDRVAEMKAQRLKNEISKATQLTVQQVLDTYSELHLSALKTGFERKHQIEISFPGHLAKPISDLTRRDLQEAIDAKAKAGRRVSANRVRAALLAFTNWAWERGYIDNQIGASIARPTKEHARDRVLSLQEVRIIFEKTHDLCDLWGPALRLMLLTGQRRGEILKLRWDEIQVDKARFIKSGQATKNSKPHVTHLSPPALSEVLALDGERAGYLFTTTGTTPNSGVSKVKKRFDMILGREFKPWRFHDFRTAMATALSEAGESETVVDRILNHSASGSAPSAVARVYNQSKQLPQRAAALDRWAALVTGTPGKRCWPDNRFKMGD